MQLAVFALLLPILLLAAPPTLAESGANDEMLYRAEATRRLPRDAARRLFSIPAAPAQLPAQAIGAFGRGCVAGAVALEPQGPGWQVTEASLGRHFGHPKLVAWIQAFAAGVQADGGPALLIGDMAQPRGGPMLTGHASHQLGLEADIWLSSVDLVRPDLLEVTADFTPAHVALLRRAARMPEVDRIFVNAAIKQAACRSVANDTGERGWLRKLRPWPGHSYHFHVALECTDAACAARPPVLPGDGCGKELTHWFREDVRFPKRHPPEKILKLKDLPNACRAVLAAP